MKILSLALILSVVFGGCVSAPDPWTGEADVALEMDEASLWKQSREAVDLFRKAGMIFDDPELVSYLEEVALNLYPEIKDSPSEFRILIINDTRLNAFMFANGVMCIHTGLLSILENEAQVATVLAHEIAHYVHRHSLHTYRNLKAKSAFHATVGAASSGYGSLFSGMVVMAMMSGHSQVLETKADFEGWHRMRLAGYDTAESIKAFQHLQNYLVDIDEKEKGRLMFSSHPKLQRRIYNFKRLISQEGPLATEVEVGRKDYTPYVGEVLEVTIRETLDQRGFHQSERLIDRFIADFGMTPNSNYFLGELLRLKKNKDGRKVAEGFFEECLDLDPTHVEAHRSLGMMLFESRQWAESLYHFNQVALLDPRHRKIEFIRSYIKKCTDQLENN